LPIDKLNGEGSIKNLTCPAGCGAAYRAASTHQSDALAKLADAVKVFKQGIGCRVEFVVPVKD
jgi:hypothetical protein